MGTYLSGKLIKDCPVEVQDDIYKAFDEVDIWINTDKSLELWVDDLNGKGKDPRGGLDCLPYLERPVTVESLQEHLSLLASWGYFQDKIAPGDYYNDKRANDIIAILYKYKDYWSFLDGTKRIIDDHNIKCINEEEIKELLNIPEYYCAESPDFPEISIEDIDDKIMEILRRDINKEWLIEMIMYHAYENMHDHFYTDAKEELEREIINEK